jgi:hypothetical protein
MAFLVATRGRSIVNVALSTFAMARSSPVTRSALDVWWKGAYTPLSAFPDIPEEWLLADGGNVDGAASQGEGDDPGNASSDSCSEYIGTGTHSDPQQDVPIDEQEPGDNADADQTQSEVGLEADSGMRNQKKQKHSKRGQLSDGEVARRVAQRNGIHILHDGVLATLGKDKKPNTTKFR